MDGMLKISGRLGMMIGSDVCDISWFVNVDQPGIGNISGEPRPVDADIGATVLTC